MLRKLKTFSALPKEEKLLFLEAFILLGVMRAAILTVSFKRLTKNFHHYNGAIDPEAVRQEQEADAKRIGLIITRAANNTPWESACLVQSLTASRMLKQREIPCVFYLGVIRSKNEKGNIKAHAWSKCGGSTVTGGENNDSYTILSTFSWAG